MKRVSIKTNDIIEEFSQYEKSVNGMMNMKKTLANFRKLKNIQSDKDLIEFTGKMKLLRSEYFIIELLGDTIKVNIFEIQKEDGTIGYYTNCRHDGEKLVDSTGINTYKDTETLFVSMYAVVIEKVEHIIEFAMDTIREHVQYMRSSLKTRSDIQTYCEMGKFDKKDDKSIRNGILEFLKEKKMENE